MVTVAVEDEKKKKGIRRRKRKKISVRCRYETIVHTVQLYM